jgi:hypothetical protein
VTTQRDLVDANSFNRRRLVSAFICGSSGGHEFESVRPIRTVVVGLVLALLLVAGAAIVRVLAPSLPEGWSSVHLGSVEAVQPTGPGR